MRLTDRNDYQQLLASLLEPLKLKMTEGKARIRLQGSGATYSPSVQEMEAFARPLWGLVPFWAGGGSHPEWEEIYQTGIANGTNPEHPEYWGDCTDHDQRFVEMAPLAYGLLAAKHVLWEPLSVVEQDRFVAWLRQINDHTFSDNNWRFFRVLVNLALARVGKAHDAGLLESDLTHIESWHVGSGWYVDGQANQKDYYGPFALHFYGLLYAQFAQESDPKRSRQFVEWAKLFANDFIYWFDREGRALPYGRSLTYRFAQSAFFSAALDHLDPALAKGVIGRNLRFWMNQEIFEGTRRFRSDTPIQTWRWRKNITLREARIGLLRYSTSSAFHPNIRYGRWRKLPSPCLIRFECVLTEIWSSAIADGMRRRSHWQSTTETCWDTSSKNMRNLRTVRRLVFPSPTHRKTLKRMRLTAC